MTKPPRRWRAIALNHRPSEGPPGDDLIRTHGSRATGQPEERGRPSPSFLLIKAAISGCGRLDVSARTEKCHLLARRRSRQDGEEPHKHKQTVLITAGAAEGLVKGRGGKKRLQLHRSSRLADIRLKDRLFISVEETDLKISHFKQNFFWLFSAPSCLNLRGSRRRSAGLRAPPENAP